MSFLLFIKPGEDNYLTSLSASRKGGKPSIPKSLHSASDGGIIAKPELEIAPDILIELQSQIQEEGQVVVHCISKAAATYDHYIRVWPTTYLLDQHSPHRSDLVHVENVVMAPMWQLVPAGAVAHYSLIFSGLPKSCTVFDLEEIIPLPGRFSAKNIARNEMDVYYVRL
jgi:hypothetical protein